MAAPVVAQIPLDAAIQGRPYRGPVPQLLAGTPPFSWTLLEGPLGMAADPDTGTVTWLSPVMASTPETVTVQVSNADGSDTLSFPLLTVSLSAFPGSSGYERALRSFHADDDRALQQAGIGGETVVIRRFDRAATAFNSEYGEAKTKVYAGDPESTLLPVALTGHLHSTVRADDTKPVVENWIDLLFAVSTLELDRRGLTVPVSSLTQSVELPPDLPSPLYPVLLGDIRGDGVNRACLVSTDDLIVHRGSTHCIERVRPAHQRRWVFRVQLIGRKETAGTFLRTVTRNIREQI